jgi:tRNA nucleotidyltransferase (CCA-adding enzyme)
MGSMDLEVYLVGGAVRDQLLGLPVRERDYVVVSATEQEMLDLGYSRVGKDFPVYLHPKTHEEYALARTERKTGRGYKGFAFNSDSSITLEEDLCRRDLTINAIAMTLDGKTLVDPFHGQKDLKQRIIRHVSPAFVEDPLRILRLARFAAYLTDFKVHPETMELLKKMVKDGELTDLAKERMWREWQKSLRTPQPTRFWEILQDCGAKLQLAAKLEISDRVRAAVNSVAIAQDEMLCFASLFLDSPEECLADMSKHFALPRRFQQLALCVLQNFYAPQDLLVKNSAEILDCLAHWGLWRQGGFWGTLCQLWQGLYTDAADQAAMTKLQQIAAGLLKITIANVDAELKGAEIGKAIREHRLVYIQGFLHCK